MVLYIFLIVLIDKSKVVLCESMGFILEWGIEGYDKGEFFVYIGIGFLFYMFV